MNWISQVTYGAERSATIVSHNYCMIENVYKYIDIDKIIRLNFLSNKCGSNIVILMSVTSERKADLFIKRIYASCHHLILLRYACSTTKNKGSTTYEGSELNQHTYNRIVLR